MGTVITGYRIEKQSFNEVQDLIEKIKKIVSKKAKEYFLELLKEEITFLVDNISLNVINRPDGISIFDAALNELKQKVIKSSSRTYGTKFDFSVSLHILTDDNNKIYIRFNSGNDIYSEELKHLDELTEFNLTKFEVDTDADTEHHITWKAIMKKYENTQPLGCRILDTEFMEITIDDIKNFEYASIEERADTIARRDIISEFLQKYSCEEQIPPFRTVQYIEYAIEQTDSDYCRDKISEKFTTLLRILPDINFELVTQ